MNKNRRFPFERSKEPILFEHFSTTENQLYPIIRQYASISRPSDQPKPQHAQQEIVSHQENDRLEQLMSHLKQKRNDRSVDINDFSTLRERNIQHWKQIKSKWQQYYREEIRKQQEIFDRVIKTSR